MGGMILGIIRKLFGGGHDAAPGINIGIGTSMLCMYFGHKFTRKVPEWSVTNGCPNCFSKGRVPFRPPGGGPMGSRLCDVCKGSGVDPDNPLPEDFGKKKKRKRREPEPIPDAHLPAENVYDTLDESTWWDTFIEWWRGVREPEGSPAAVETDEDTPHFRKRGPNDPNPEPRPGKRVKFIAASCARCGAVNPSFTEPPTEVGIIGKLLRYLF